MTVINYICNYFLIMMNKRKIFVFLKNVSLHALNNL